MPVTCPACKKPSAATDASARCEACGSALFAVTEAPTMVMNTPATGGPPTEELLKEGQLLGGCRIERLLGQGGMGSVYLGIQQSLGRKVAVKTLASQLGSDPAFVARFDREAAALANLSHPNIVGVYDKGVQDGIYFFAMEFVEGVSLRQLMQQTPRRVPELLKVLPAICEALDYAHAQGVVHRDIKPENLLVTRSGQPKIADFGLAHLTQGPQDLALTQTQSIMGTMDYMAPEARISAKAGDHRVDVYAMGVVLYEILTGEMPLGHFPPPSERGQDPRFDEVVYKALERDPAKRYPHVGEIGRAVSRITTTPPPRPGDRGDFVPAGGRFGASAPLPSSKPQVSFSCSCGHAFTVDASRAGSDILCTGCGKIVRIPSRPGSGEAAPAKPPTTPAQTVLMSAAPPPPPSAPPRPCPQCGTPLLEGAPQCLKCGMSVRKMGVAPVPSDAQTKPCPACHRPIPYVALGCRHCGAFFDDPESMAKARDKGGFPWDARSREGLWGSGLSTLRGVLFKPSETFGRLAANPSAGAALSFHLTFGMASAALCLVWYAFLFKLPSLPESLKKPRPLGPVFVGGLATAALLPLLQGALTQAGLFLTGGPGRAGLKGSLAVALYTAASALALAGAIPACGATAALLWTLPVFLIGISRVQGCGIGRALLAALLGPAIAAALLLTVLSPARALAGPEARDWAELGLEKARAGLHAEAVTALRKALDLDPGDARAWNNLGASLGRLGRVPEEIAAYRRALEREPELDAAWRNLDTATGGPGDGRDRVTIRRKVAERFPEDPKAWSELGRAYLAEGRAEESIPPLRRVLKLTPADAPAWDAMGLAYARADRLEDAVQAFARAVDLRPDWEAARAHLSGARAAVSPPPAPPEPRRPGQPAPQGKPEDAEAWGDLGAFYLSLGKREQAMEAFEKAVRIQPGSFRTWSDLGRLYFGFGKLTEAAQALKMATVLNPGDTRSRKLLEQASSADTQEQDDLNKALAGGPPTWELLSKLPGEWKIPCSALFETQGSAPTLRAYLGCPRASGEQIRLWTASAQDRWEWKDQGEAPASPETQQPHLARSLRQSVDPNRLWDALRKVESEQGRIRAIRAIADEQKRELSYSVTVLTGNGTRECSIPFDSVASDATLKLIASSKKNAEQIACLSRLKTLLCAIRLYQERKGCYPQTLEDLWQSKDVSDLPSFLCPGSGRTATTGFSSDYVYTPPERMLSAEEEATWMLVYDSTPLHEKDGKESRSVLFVNGSAQRLEENDFQTRLKAQTPSK